MPTVIPVLWCSKHEGILARGYADQGLLEGILDRSVWCPQDAVEFDHQEVRDDFPDVEGAVVIINARTHANERDVQWLLDQLDRLAWSVVLLCGDEEWVFPWRRIKQTPRQRVWVMQARPEHQGLSGFLPGGWYPQTPELLADHQNSVRDLDWFFGGQITHHRRHACAEVLRTLPDGVLVETKSYLEEGIPKADYFEMMTQAVVIPCPSGPYSVDCARAFEALEAGCIPVADTVTAHGDTFDYWTLLFGEEPPFPRITDWSTFPDVLAELLNGWQHRSIQTFAWWQQKKRQLARKLEADIRYASGTSVLPETPDDLITVVVTTSPVPSHPSTDHIEQTIASIRESLPTAEIVVVADGVRPEQADRTEAYETYLSRLLWLCNFQWSNVVPVVLPEWGHQANATRAAMQFVDTPLLLFIEHDTPLVGDIPWAGLCDAVQEGTANAIRLHQDVEIHPDHERVMLDDEPKNIGGVPLRRTAAWWQRPHLASTAFYRRILERFPASSRTMIEDVLYGVVWSDWEDYGEVGWDQWRIWIYQPDGDMRRSGHLDSRGEDEKFEMWL